ncbi:uncharacterized protein Z520_04421 [Fonsecaea multimorphosa CBS 102226]|uniref:Mid2 domain-containing protein n=1 Tax=Fonsecaea multimorphosa CBS 102226 TaxID=1442371 RepID=A0A0D2HD28_9EURO|nr:uncharacterized protein Z520_04421 [Fonsecaea multimorphosa CBS 102226]KIX99785.1 hypothetical protein Z520_04421 [Fonsecaea multimorphosa CBS 102226]OAL26573.1 hypothetical protein AYO22_04184 [Fonsecaea multimorphosa]
MRLGTASLLGLLALPFVALAQSEVYTTDTNGNAYTTTVYTSGSTYDGATTTSFSAPTYVPAIQTVPYTGQALLVGTCNIARFTLLTFPNGDTVEVPLVGCSDDRPECCPSLNFTHSEPEETGSASPSATESSDEGDGHESSTAWTGTTPSPTPTGVVSMLSNAPLTVCPSDMVDIDPVCCPSGFTTYGESIIGNLPCVSTLTTTISPDSAVLASITSMVSASLAAQSTMTTTTPTINVIVNQVWALGLPCADDEEGGEEGDHTHLSTGAKVGIAVGVGVGGLLIIGFLWACLAVRHRRRAKMRKLEAANTAAGGPIRPESGAYAAAQENPKHASMASTMVAPTPSIGSPNMHEPYGSPPGTHGFSPAFGYAAPPQAQPPQMMQMQVQQDPYGHAYGIHTIPQGYPLVGYPQSQSPPPPFYPSGGGGGSYGSQAAGQYKDAVPAEVAGNDVPVRHNNLSPPHRDSAGFSTNASASDTRSQITSTTNTNTNTAVGSWQPPPGAEPKPPAELS